MPLEKLNAALIGAIQNSTPEYTNAAAILTDKLNIGREAAYRRRGFPAGCAAKCLSPSGRRAYFRRR